MGDAAVFLDRDDTLVMDSGFIDDPDKVHLVPDAIDAVTRLNHQGFKVVVVSNQSGVARGLFDETTLASIHDRLRSLLAAGGARLDGIYYCPFLEGSAAVVDRYRTKSELRKPEPGMLIQAAGEMDIDLSRSWMIGDSARDVQAGRAAGCRTILIDLNGESEQAQDVPADARVASLTEAVDIVERDGDESAARAEQSNPDDRVDDYRSLLVEIRDLLDRAQRTTLQDDFSLARLFGTLLQMLAVFVAAWGVFAMLGDDITTALARFALASFIQLALISLLLSDRHR